MILLAGMVALLGVCAYAWVVYPLVLRVVAGRRRPGAHAVLDPRAADLSVGVVLSAYNEEAHIAGRIRNLLAEAPAGRPYEIHIGVDASSDRTAEEARRAAAGHPNVHVHAFSQRRGKVAVLKDLVAPLTCDLLVFTDANTCFTAGTLGRLLAPFADACIGGVCGRLALVSAPAHAAADASGRVETDAATQEGFYWRWETSLKIRESAVDSCLGANGAIFAMRRPLFWGAVPDHTMVDDFVLGMKVREQGARVIYVPEAVAVEELPEVRHEWGRRVRIGAGDYQALMLCWRCLLPRYHAFAWSFWSHKVLRWFTPHAALLLAGLGAASVAIGTPVAQGLGVLILAGFAVFGAMACAGFALSGSRARWARLPALFLHYGAMQAALLAGFARFITGNVAGHWTRTPRAVGAGTTERPRHKPQIGE